MSKIFTSERIERKNERSGKFFDSDIFLDFYQQRVIIIGNIWINGRWTIKNNEYLAMSIFFRN